MIQKKAARRASAWRAGLSILADLSVAESRANAVESRRELGANCSDSNDDDDAHEASDETVLDSRSTALVLDELVENITHICAPDYSAVAGVAVLPARCLDQVNDRGDFKASRAEREKALLIEEGPSRR